MSANEKVQYQHFTKKSMVQLILVGKWLFVFNEHGSHVLRDGRRYFDTKSTLIISILVRLTTVSKDSKECYFEVFSEA